MAKQTYEGKADQKADAVEIKNVKKVKKFAKPQRMAQAPKKKIID